MQEALVIREKDLLERLTRFLTNFGAPLEDTRLVRQTLADMEELFMLVIVGEFNAGKSAFANALLGELLSPEGTTPTTDEVTVLKYGATPSENHRREGILEKCYPNDVLREISIVDTPGTNAVMRHHEELSQAFVPRSDLVLFVTSADRPFTESEREYLEMIRNWGKKIVRGGPQPEAMAGDGTVHIPAPEDNSGRRPHPQPRRRLRARARTFWTRSASTHPAS